MRQQAQRDIHELRPTRFSRLLAGKILTSQKIKWAINSFLSYKSLEEKKSFQPRYKTSVKLFFLRLQIFSETDFPDGKYSWFGEK